MQVAQTAGGIEMLADSLAAVMTENTAAPIMALIGGLLSTASSASGVVMPALIPMAPSLAADVGGEGVRIISAVIIGSHMVTVSPLSTLGALVMAAAGEDVDKQKLFKSLLALAFAGLVYAALIVYLEVVFVVKNF